MESESVFGVCESDFERERGRERLCSRDSESLKCPDCRRKRTGNTFISMPFSIHWQSEAAMTINFFHHRIKSAQNWFAPSKKGNSHKNCGFVLCTQFGSNYNSPHWRCLAGSDVLVILIFYLSKWNIRGTTKTNQQNTISGYITINFKHTHKLTSAHANFHI